MIRKIYYSILLIGLVFILSSCNNPFKHVHSFGDGEVVIEASCSSFGKKQRECK